MALVRPTDGFALAARLSRHFLYVHFDSHSDEAYAGNASLAGI